MRGGVRTEVKAPESPARLFRSQADCIWKNKEESA